MKCVSWEGSIHRVSKALDALGLPVARLVVPLLLWILAHQLRHLPLVQLRLLRRAHDLWLDAQSLKEKFIEVSETIKSYYMLVADDGFPILSLRLPKSSCTLHGWSKKAADQSGA